MSRSIAAAVAAVLVIAAPAGAATKAEWQQNATVVPKFGDQIGFIPIKGMQPTMSARQRIKVGRRVYKVRWFNTISNARTAAVAVKGLGKYDPESGLFLDRALTPQEARRLEVLAEVGRDADVLVVHRDNAACGGLTYGQARAIAAGEVGDWSQVGSSAGAVRLHLRGRGFPQGQFGVEQLPAGARLDEDGGLGAAFEDPAAAAVTSWSRVRDLGGGVCVVPLDGIAASDETVRGLSFPGAYAVNYVMSRERSRRRIDRARVKAYVAFLKSAKAGAMFAAAGVLR